MADSSKAEVASVDDNVAKPIAESTVPADTSEKMVNGASVVEEDNAEGEPISAASAADVPASTDAQGDTKMKEDDVTAVADAGQETTAPDGSPALAADTGEGAADGAEGTPTSSKKNNQRRKSAGGIPEHKTKKLNKKKSSANLNLAAEPGDYFWARLKGYPPWPAIVCDEEMLPASLLANRPVSAKRVDGTYREDFLEGGKHAKDRTYPMMYLGTNEFGWVPNTALTPLDTESLKAQDQGKKTKQLWEAYQIGAEHHDLEYFKHVLAEHDQRRQIDAEEAEEAAKKKAAKKEKKGKPKGKVSDDEDVEMEDAVDDDEAEPDKKKPKASKKRKADADSEVEGQKPAKTPKTNKLKVNGPKTPASESAAKKKTPKPKKTSAKQQEEEDHEKASPKDEEQGLTEQEKIARREKSILWLRHKLQRGFLTRDQTPKEEEMQAMSEHLASLEAHPDLEASIIRTTKVNKVLKGILRLASIPKEEVYNFKDRSTALLAKWNAVMVAESSAADAVNDAAKATTNGTVEEVTDDKALPSTEPAEAPVETDDNAGNKAMDEADVTMQEASKAETEVSATKEVEPASAEAATAATEGVSSTS